MELMTPEMVRYLFDYCPETGVIRNRTWRSNRAKAGQVAGSIHQQGYRIIRVAKKHYRGHWIAWAHFYGDWPTDQVDHMNGIRDDNRICNLRACSGAANSQNIVVERRTTDMPQGVTRLPSGNYSARIKINRKHTHIGVYSTCEAAHDAYLSAKKESHPFFNPDRLSSGGDK